MVGVYNLKVNIKNKNIRYNIELSRNFTILKGESSTGKSFLVESILEMQSNRSIGISCEAQVIVCNSVNNIYLYKQLKKAIIVIDENVLNGCTQAEYDEMMNSGLYYLLITRKSLPLPYSVFSIYEIHSKGKNEYTRNGYIENELINYYQKEKVQFTNNNITVVEDLKAGNEFFASKNQMVYPKKGLGHPLNKGGNGNVENILQYLKNNNINSRIDIIVDSSCFGKYIENLIASTKEMDCKIYLPESFEWLLLKAMNDRGINKILESVQDYCDSKKYVSWERFFTKTLKDFCNKNNLKYSKTHLNKYFLRYYKDVLKIISEEC